MALEPKEQVSLAVAASNWPRRRIAVVVQRYGEGLLGGAEAHARDFVEAVRAHHELTVLTSCTSDGFAWPMDFTPGTDQVNGVRVLRFAHPLRNEGGRARVPRRHKLRFLVRRWLDAAGRGRVSTPRGDDVLDGQLFLRRQGPYCEGLVKHLRESAERYDAVVFFTALFHPTAEGLPAWGGRSVLVPLLHDEKAMYLPWFHHVFRSAGETLYNTDAERRLARRLYGDDAASGSVVGLGIEIAEVDGALVREVAQRYGLPERYLVYVGRIEKGKGCLDLLSAWRSLGTLVGDAALVFVGKGALPIPDLAGIRALGFVPAEVRDAVVKGARALVMPSRFESLSAVLLQAMALGVPVLANADCEVLREQVMRSQAGSTYRGRRELRRGLLHALDRGDGERRALGEAGRRFVAANYGAQTIAARWLGAIDRICSPSGVPTQRLEAVAA